MLAALKKFLAERRTAREAKTLKRLSFVDATEKVSKHLCQIDKTETLTLLNDEREHYPEANRMQTGTRYSVNAIKATQLNDLADEDISSSGPFKVPSVKYSHKSERSTVAVNEASATDEKTNDDDEPKLGCSSADPLSIIRANLPPDPLLRTPFGKRRMTYADYTASGRSLYCIEEYIRRVVQPMYANTHTETSATGLQTTHAREEARDIILKSLGASHQDYSLIFTGTGSTGAIWKLIAMLGIHVPKQMMEHMDMSKIERPLVLTSQAEHHSNELMWRETIADVIAIPMGADGGLDLDFLYGVLESNRDKYKLIIGSFTAGSNVTGLISKPGPIASLMHKYGAYACFDYAGAGAYKKITMGPNIESDPDSYLDAVFCSPHKFVGGPGTPGLLCVRKSFVVETKVLQHPPTIAGGGTVTMVWPSSVSALAKETNRCYESTIHVREEGGTPGVIESIRCGLAFHVRDLVTTDVIEEKEGKYAAEAVRQMQAAGIWVMGDQFSQITSEERLSITSFNIWSTVPSDGDGAMGDVPAGTLRHPSTGKPLMLHFHFVAALLNDVYGIQARSGCACAGPLSFRLFGERYPFMTTEAIKQLIDLADRDLHSLKPGFCRVNFNYFIEQDEFDYILAAIRQIAQHGWKLLPLYALCLKTGQYWYNGLQRSEQDGRLVSFNRFDTVRRLKEMQFEDDGTVSWNEGTASLEDRTKYLDEALKIYDNAPQLVRQMLFRFRDLRRRDMEFPEHLQKYRFFALGSEVLPSMGITKEELAISSNSTAAKDESINPLVVAYPAHETANPMFTFSRPTG